MSPQIPAAGADVLVSLTPRPEAARLARRALERRGMGEDVGHSVSLLATEVVANAVRHAGLADHEQIVFYAHLEDDFARVEVADAGPGFDPDGVDYGFGLRLVEKIATDWGVDRTRGCRVWFEVDRRSRRFRRSLGAA
jgi:anti-sigma regulatory factor (Ser/Thr protein kinase)